MHDRQIRFFRNICKTRGQSCALAAIAGLWCGITFLVFRLTLSGSDGTTSEIVHLSSTGLDPAPPSSTVSATSTTTLPPFTSYVPVAMVLDSQVHSVLAVAKLVRSVRSVLAFSSVPVNLIIVADKKMFDLAENAVKRNVTIDKAKLRISYLNLDDAVEFSKEYVAPFRKLFQEDLAKPVDRFSFLLSTAMHRILPFHSRVIYLEPGIVFKGDVSQLFAQFENFDQSHTMGVIPPPTNSSSRQTAKLDKGVILFDLNSMRKSVVFTENLDSVRNRNGSVLPDLKAGGDDNILQFLVHEYPRMFFVLPCQWRRHLCGSRAPLVDGPGYWKECAMSRRFFACASSDSIKAG